jgi:hypothetical protein
LALAFSPFLFSTLVNGQLASVAVFCIGLAIRQELRGCYFQSGLVLGVLAYKPTLLVLLIPMLFFTRRFRTLLGFVMGAGVLTLLATVADGIGVWPAYGRMLRGFSEDAGVGTATHLRLWQYMDLHSTFVAILQGKSTAGLIALGSFIVIVAISLGLLLFQSARADRPAQSLAWAATLTWTLLLNVYVPIYDSVLAVPAVILTLGALRELRWSRTAEWITALAVVTFAISWKTESFAAAHKVQLLTLALLILGAAQLVFLKRALRQQPG